MNGDGVDDIIIGASGADPGGNDGAGESYVVFGVSVFSWIPVAGGSFDTDGNWLGGIAPDNGGSVVIQPEFGGTISGPSGTVVTDRLTLDAGTGTATLDIPAGGLVIVNDRARIKSGGRLSGDGTFVTREANFRVDGAIDLGTNSLQVVSENDLTNNGAIIGSGMLDVGGVLTNNGEMEVGPGENLEVGATTLSNTGRIAVIGTAASPGQVRFDTPVTNSSSTGQIVARNARFHFEAGLVNEGALAMSFGTTDIFGDVSNTGTMVVGGNSAATFYEDVDNSGVLNVATGSTVVFFGALTGNGNSGGGDVQALGDIAPGSSPGMMTFGGGLVMGPLTNVLIELGGRIEGEFDLLNIAGTAVLGGDLFVNLIDGFTPGADDVFTIAEAATLVGTFNNVSSGNRVNTNDGRGSLLVSYQDGVNAVVLSDFALFGDLDCDGDVDFDDIAPFVLGLNDPTGYEATFGVPPALKGDTDTDGDFDFDDIARFVAILNAPLTAAGQPVPEPSSIVMTLLAVASLLACGRRVQDAPWL